MYRGWGTPNYQLLLKAVMYVPAHPYLTSHTSAWWDDDDAFHFACSSCVTLTVVCSRDLA